MARAVITGEGRQGTPRLAAVACAAALGAGVALQAGAAQPPSDPAGRGLDPAMLERAVVFAQRLPRLHALIVARDGVILFERAFRGPGLDVPVNVKSVSKTLVAALVGAAIDRGILDNTGQPIAAVLGDRMPAGGDPRLARITVGHLLSMRAGLERTSGRNYGRWVKSRDWVRFVLSRPFVDEPGRAMLYSTGSTHLLSAMLTRAAARSTLALMREWIAEPLGFRVVPWQTDPQGIYFGGNNMLLAPHALLRFGEMYRNGGVYLGRRVLPASWVRESWIPRTVSRFSGHEYGYGWFLTEACGHALYYARGFGGQFLYVAPSLGLTIVITSDTRLRTRVGGYRDALRTLVEGHLIGAAIRADGGAGCPS